MTGRANGTSSRSAANGDGVSALTNASSTTATTSWTIRMPIATRPCTARSSRLPSSTFAASTVLEKPKLTANASASPGENQPPSDGGRDADDAGQQQVRDRRAPDLVAQQRLDAQLEADGEQQQQDAGVREVDQHRGALHAERREHETRCEEADERR